MDGFLKSLALEEENPETRVKEKAPSNIQAPYLARYLLIPCLPVTSGSLQSLGPYIR
jgi:hypothetical protein